MTPSHFLNIKCTSSVAWTSLSNLTPFVLVIVLIISVRCFRFKITNYSVAKPNDHVKRVFNWIHTMTFSLAKIIIIFSAALPWQPIKDRLFTAVILYLTKVSFVILGVLHDCTYDQSPCYGQIKVPKILSKTPWIL